MSSFGNYEKINLHEISGEAMAYLGDSVLELMVRLEVVSNSAGKKSGALNAMAMEYVTAHAQSAAVEKIIGLLTEDEVSVYKRGRNLNGIAIPKSAASASEYRRATGLETLFAYLYLTGQNYRMNELFNIAFCNDHSGEDDKSGF